MELKLHNLSLIPVTKFLMHPPPLLDDLTREVLCSIPSALLEIFSSRMKIRWAEMKNAQGTSAWTFSQVCKKRYTFVCIIWNLDQLILFSEEYYFVCYPFLLSGQEVDKLRQMCKPFRKRKVVTTLFFSVQITLTVFPYFSVGKGTICQQGVVPNLT